MFHFSKVFAALAVGALALGDASPAAADEAAVIKVALLDASAVLPTQSSGNPVGQMMGFGMGGPGMMGRGGFGGMGMGVGMGMGMGMMSIRADRSAAKSGPVTFAVTNWSRSLVHEMLVVAVDGPDAALPYDYGTGRVMEEQVKSFGETGELQPNATKSLTLTLPPGTYLLLCNVAGHYAAGMVTPLTVEQ